MIAYINATANYSCVAGSPTLSTDLPSGVVQYVNAPVAGSAKIAADSASYQLRQGSTATIQVDMATKVVTIAMHLVGTNGSASRDFGNFSGTGTLNLSNGSISGTWTWPDYTGGTTMGTFSGSLFGSQGREIGLALSIGATDRQTPAQWYFTASGDIVLRRF